MKVTLLSPNFSLSSANVFSPISLLMSDRQTCNLGDDVDDGLVDDLDDDVDDDDETALVLTMKTMTMMMANTLAPAARSLTAKALPSPWAEPVMIDNLPCIK